MLNLDFWMKNTFIGPEHTNTLITINNLGNLYKVQGCLEDAESIYNRVLAEKAKLRRQ
jgi:hypothetical protein